MMPRHRFAIKQVAHSVYDHRRGDIHGNIPVNDDSENGGRKKEYQSPLQHFSDETQYFHLKKYGRIEKSAQKAVDNDKLQITGAYHSVRH